MLQEELEKMIILSLRKGKRKGIIDYPKDFSFSVTLSPEDKFGDFTTDVAFRLAKFTKKKPEEIAEIIKENFSQRKALRKFRKIEIEKGYINFFLKKEEIFQSFLGVAKKGGKKMKIGLGKTVVVDYSSPNIAKPFGIGHLRSTIIGQAILNIYKFLGYKCIGDNHLGDWGTQFGKLICEIEKEISSLPKKERKKFLHSLTVRDLEKMYIRFHQKAKKNPELEEKARDWFRKLESGDKEALRIWRICRKISLREFQRIYNILGVKIDNILGESFYKELARKVVKEALRKGKAKKSQRAIIFDFAGKYPPAILLKSDGTTTYFSRDMATIKFRLEKWKPSLIIYEVGKEQTLYFQQLFEAAKMMGWIKKEKLFHLAHGLFRGKFGKLSTRKGETVHLEEVLKEAIERAKRLISSSEIKTEKEKEKISQIVGIGAVKFNDLSQDPSKDIDFNWKKILNLKGDSSAYIQYTACRIKSLLRKSRKRRFIFSGELKFEIEREERELMKEIIKFPEVIIKSAERFSPNILAKFSLNLAKKYNYFYDKLPILSVSSLERRNFRLYLSFVTYKFLERSLNMLGIEIPPKM